MKTPWPWSRLRKALSRNDLRAALLGIAGGALLAAVVTLSRSMDNPYESGAGDQERSRLVQLWGDYRQAISAMRLVEVMIWNEAWVPVEWRSWARPVEELSWPPPDTSTDCPPGAYCCPEVPDPPCHELIGRWTVATPMCPFESAPISELPWARGHFGEGALDSTGQGMWLGCQLTEGKWHIVSIEVGPDGDALTDDDRVRECGAPETGWPHEFWRGWPELERVAPTETPVSEVASAILLNARQVRLMESALGQR